MHVVTVNVRPNQFIRFPNLCVHCGHNAAQRMTIRRQQGQIIRTVDVPVCEACARLQHRRSAQEAQRLRLGWLVGSGMGLLLLAMGLLLTPADWSFGLRLLLGVLIGGVVGTAVWLLFRVLSRRAMLPDKRALLNAAQITRFTPDQTTFSFAYRPFAERVQSLNPQPQP